MWFEKKKTEEEPKKEKSWEETAMEEIKSFRDIGEKFNYLGVEMMVTGHFDVHFPLNVYDSLRIKPCLKVDYVTKNGEIKGGTFYVKDLPMLRKENP